MTAMHTKPYVNESKKDIMAVFKKYDRSNKGHLNLDDIKEMNNHIKGNLDEESMRLMV
jgi:Ca2+-binding EF-hand superfamily protein